VKGIVIAGGLGTRVGPSTLIANKHCLPIYDKPMIYYPINTLRQLGCKDIAVIFSPPFGNQIVTLLGNGSQFGINVTYLVQTKPDGGIADALQLAEGFANGENIAVILGDNVMDDKSVETESFKDGCRIYLKVVDNPQEFGVAEFSRGSIIRLVEKPVGFIGNDAVIGIYLYDRTVFDKIKACKPSPRGQLEITDVNDLYLKEKKLQWRRFDGFWQDCGTPDKILQAGLYQQSCSSLLREASDLSQNIHDLIRLTKVPNWNYEGGAVIHKEEWIKLYSFIREIIPYASGLDPVVLARGDGTYRLEFSAGSNYMELSGRLNAWQDSGGKVLGDKEAVRAIERFLKGSNRTSLMQQSNPVEPMDQSTHQNKLIKTYKFGIAALALLRGTEFDKEMGDDDPIAFQLTTQLDSIWKKLSSHSVELIDAWIANKPMEELCQNING
jgi:glucose-1-phosphate thymidylyltransferase